jgi:hypothetical protein
MSEPSEINFPLYFFFGGNMSESQEEQKTLPFTVGEVGELKSCSMTTSMLPIVWFGEKTEPVVRGFGQLVSVNGEAAVRRLLWSDRLDQDLTPLKLPATYIICGGVEPQIQEVQGYVKMVADAKAKLPDIGGNILMPSGVGYKTYALLCSPVPVPPQELKPTEPFEAYNPPYVWWVDPEKRTVKCIAAP